MSTRSDPNLAEAFGERVRNIRKDTGHRLTQEQLAELMDVTPGYVGQIERGVTNVTLLTIAKVAFALGVDPADLVHGLKPTAARRRQVGTRARRRT